MKWLSKMLMNFDSLMSWLISVLFMIYLIVRAVGWLCTTYLDGFLIMFSSTVAGVLRV